MPGTAASTMSSDDTSVKMKLSEESSPNIPSMLLSDDPDTVKSSETKGRSAQTRGRNARQ